MSTPTAPSSCWPRRLLVLVVTLVLVVLPWLTSGYVGRIVINACRNLVLALSFDIVGAIRGTSTWAMRRFLASARMPLACASMLACQCSWPEVPRSS